MVQRIFRIVSGLGGILFLALGLLFLLAPSAQISRFAIQPDGDAGLSTLRGDFGGLFLGMGFFALIGAIVASRQWLIVPVVFLAFIILGRILNLFLDGKTAAARLSLTVELIIAAVLLLTIVTLPQTRSAGFALATLSLLMLAVLGAALLFQRQIGLMMYRQIVEQQVNHHALEGLPDGLAAGLCGSGSPMVDPTRAGPCVFVMAGKHLYIVDAGEGTTRKMMVMGISPGSIDAILLTHFHSDHIGGLGELMLERWGAGSHKDPVPVIGPQGVSSVVDGFNAAYVLDKGYRVAHHGEVVMPSSGQGGAARSFTIASGSAAGQIVLQQDGLTITAFPVNHLPVFPAVGYRFDYGGRSVVVSGDTAPSATLAFNARGGDVLFHEGLQTTMVSITHDALTRAGRGGLAQIMADIPVYHTRPEDAARIAQDAGVHALVFYHTIPPLPFAYLNAAFLGDAPKIFKGSITVGKDGLLVILPAGTSTITMRSLL